MTAKDWTARLAAAALVLTAAPAPAQTLPTAPADPAAPAVRLGPGLVQAPLIVVPVPAVAVSNQRLDAARSSIQASLGATRYDLSRRALQTLPQGDDAPLSQVLLQVPGAAEDSFGQVHIRGEHNDLQYRINGVQLPEGLQGFGESIETRLAFSVALITGALPAQYGFRTGAVVDLQTKTGTNSPGRAVSLYGGGRGVTQPSFEYGGRFGPVDYFVTGDYLHTGVGIENPTSGVNALHDTGDQFRGFAVVSGLLDDTTRLSLLSGTFEGEFQIPPIPRRVPTLGLAVNGVSTSDSGKLDERQRELNQFGVLSLQKQDETVGVEASLFTRYSTLRYSPDAVGDLLFNGLAENALRQSDAYGAQVDASWHVSAAHTLRGGFLAQGERTTGRTAALVLPVDASGAPIGDQPVSVLDKTAKTGGLYGLYLQDEWRLRPGLTVNYGARFDVVDEYTRASQLSPRVNVVWTPLKGTTLHAGYARYFQTPPFELVANTSLARFAGTTAAPAVTQDDPVKAERSHYFDAGISQVLLPGLVVGVDGYFKLARNLIDEGQFGAPIILTPFNYARGQVSGVELTTSYDRGPLALYGNLAYSRAIGKGIVSSQFNFSATDLAYIASHYIHLDHDQRWTGSGGAAYTVFAGTRWPLRASADLVVGSGLRASAGSDIPNGRALGGYYVVNVSFVQRLDLGLWRGTEARLDVLNLLDRKYGIRDGSGVGVGNPQYGLRRAILGGVTQRF
jgi:outer membrane cobalamin receptor